MKQKTWKHPNIRLYFIVQVFLVAVYAKMEMFLWLACTFWYKVRRKLRKNTSLEKMFSFSRNSSAGLKAFCQEIRLSTGILKYVLIVYTKMKLILWSIRTSWYKGSAEINKKQSSLKKNVLFLENISPGFKAFFQMVKSRWNRHFTKAL